MSDAFIFVIGVFVTSLVTGAIALLTWAALTTEDSAHDEAAPATHPRLNAVGRNETGFAATKRSGRTDG